MGLKKFGQQDILRNTMKTHPQCDFFIYNAQTYYNDMPELSGNFSAQVRNVPPGNISLYEYNIDKSGSWDFVNQVYSSTGKVNAFIYPFILKDSARASFRTAVSAGTESEWVKAGVGDVLYGAYPLSASIYRTAFYAASNVYVPPSASAAASPSIPETYVYDIQQEWISLRNRLGNYEGRSPHYAVSSSLGDKNLQNLNIIYIPSIFYGSEIKPGSLSLKWYITGTLAAELRDTKRNGELIQYSTGDDWASDNDGKVAGVVLYEEGILILTGSWHIHDPTGDSIVAFSGTLNSKSDPTYVARRPRWTGWGAGIEGDGIKPTLFPADSWRTSFTTASFGLSFKGTTETQVLTMFAHAKKGEVNFSNNPSYIKRDQELYEYTSSHIYEEKKNREIVNFASSSYPGYAAPFKRQVMVSRVALYDENKNLIGVATLANPILKDEDEAYTFKIRLDI